MSLFDRPSVRDIRRLEAAMEDLHVQIVSCKNQIRSLQVRYQRDHTRIQELYDFVRTLEVTHVGNDDDDGIDNGDEEVVDEDRESRRLKIAQRSGLK